MRRSGSEHRRFEFVLLAVSFPRGSCLDFSYQSSGSNLRWTLLCTKVERMRLMSQAKKLWSRLSLAGHKHAGTLFKRL